MARAEVVGNGRQPDGKIQRLGIMDKVSVAPTIRQARGVDTAAYRAATEKQGATGKTRAAHLEEASRLLTAQDGFSVADMHRFTDTMLEVTGSFQIGKGVEVSAVPDRIPKTGVKGITIHQEVTPTGVSVNVVYETVGDQLDKRYVLGENFGRGVPASDTTPLQVGRAERPVSETPAVRKDDSSIVYLDHNAPADVDTDKLRRRVAEDIYVAYLADADRIERSRAAAETVRELIQQGTPVTALEPAK